DPIDASANFGFVGVILGGQASLSASLSVGLEDPSDITPGNDGPGDDGKVSLTEFIKNISNPLALLDASFSGEGSVAMTLDVEGLPFIDLPDPGQPGAPKIEIDALNLGDWFDDFPDSVDLTGATVTRAADGKSFTLNGDFTDRIGKGARVK